MNILDLMVNSQDGASVITTATIVAITMGLSQAIKSATDFNNKFLPIINIILALCLTFLLTYNGNLTIAQIIADGLIAGLTSCGLYSANKNIKEGLNNVNN